ncbi:MAG: hypothetical protein J5658_12245 [Prevotella sp.]|nr:hypothetical protein [Prevotella sp.]
MCKYKDTTLGIKKLDFRSTFGRLLPKGRKNGRVATEENRNVKVAQILGHSKDLITLSLSQALTASHTLLRFAGDRALIYGFPCIPQWEAALFFIRDYGKRIYIINNLNSTQNK